MADIQVKLLKREGAFSSSQVSHATEKLDAGQLVDCAVLVAIGITRDGRHRVLGVPVAQSNAEVHWRAFLDSLIRRV